MQEITTAPIPIVPKDRIQQTTEPIRKINIPNLNSNTQTQEQVTANTIRKVKLMLDTTNPAGLQALRMEKPLDRPNPPEVQNAFARLDQIITRPPEFHMDVVDPHLKQAQAELQAQGMAVNIYASNEFRQTFDDYVTSHADEIQRRFQHALDYSKTDDNFLHRDANELMDSEIEIVVKSVYREMQKTQPDVVNNYNHKGIFMTEVNGQWQADALQDPVLLTPLKVNSMEEKYDILVQEMSPAKSEAYAHTNMLFSDATYRQDMRAHGFGTGENKSKGLSDADFLKKLENDRVPQGEIQTLMQQRQELISDLAFHRTHSKFRMTRFGFGENTTPVSETQFRDTLINQRPPLSEQQIDDLVLLRQNRIDEHAAEEANNAYRKVREAAQAARDKAESDYWEHVEATANGSLDLVPLRSVNPIERTFQAFRGRFRIPRSFIPHSREGRNTTENQAPVESHTEERNVATMVAGFLEGLEKRARGMSKHEKRIKFNRESKIIYHRGQENIEHSINRRRYLQEETNKTRALTGETLLPVDQPIFIDRVLNPDRMIRYHEWRQERNKLAVKRHRKFADNWAGIAERLDTLATNVRESQTKSKDTIAVSAAA